jgi:hypothetical protein
MAGQPMLKASCRGGLPIVQEEVATTAWFALPRELRRSAASMPSPPPPVGRRAVLAAALTEHTCVLLKPRPGSERSELLAA